MITLKRAIGSILCVLAVFRVISLVLFPEKDTTAHHVQDWALVGVLLAIGIPLSAAKKKTADGGKK